MKWQTTIAHAVVTMNALRGLEGAHDGLGPAGVHRRLLATQLHRVERILHRLVEPDIAGDNRERLDMHIGMLQRHDDRNGVVAGGVGVDEKRRMAAPYCRRRNSDRRIGLRRYPATL